MTFRFKAPLDKLSYWLSAVMVVFTATLIILSTLHYWGLLSIPVKNPNEQWIPTVAFSGVGFFLLVLMVVVYLYKPVYYQVDEEGIHIHRGVGIYTIKKDDIIRVHSAHDFNIFRTVRLFGNGGLFGYTGFFYNAQYGQVRMMATQLKSIVLIYTSKKQPFVITPDNNEAFIEACVKLGIITG